MPQLPTLTLDASALCTCVPINTPYRSAQDALKARRFYREAPTFTPLTKDGKCSICNYPLQSPSPGPKGSKRIVVYSCGHVFHYLCAKQWVEANMKNSDLCPECRKPLTDKEKSFIMSALSSQQKYPQLHPNIWKVVCEIESRYKNG